MERDNGQGVLLLRLRERRIALRPRLALVERAGAGSAGAHRPLASFRRRDILPLRQGETMRVDPNAALSDVYNELRAAAARMLRRDAPSLTLQPTELANEAALRIARLEQMSWNDRQHFFATGARIMRQAMLDAVRSRKRAKRQAPDVLLDADLAAPVEIDLLDAALVKLERESPELARIVELRFFVGLPIDQIALVLDASPSTVKRRWQTARLWLADELGFD